jgi:hypothetical protein
MQFGNNVQSFAMDCLDIVVHKATVLPRPLSPTAFRGSDDFDEHRFCYATLIGPFSCVRGKVKCAWRFHAMMAVE